ncbi:MAG: hypothetical protein UU90_C0021G0001 [candidate division WWE3 bacterium GW2011_GWD2_42_11]|nr:MAG: hypothetical protein UU90_C0021G0001 [candidate division WWE3 bacterium GW2011_GWD2_42_11]
MLWGQNPGDDSGRATPLPIPNREVKTTSAENTELVAGVLFLFSTIIYNPKVLSA